MDELQLIIGNKNYSSWSLRAWLYLRLNNIAFDEVRLPLGTLEFHQRIHDYSPTGCVPALRQGDVCVWDSLAIIEYLDGTYSPAVSWPTEPRNKALALSAVMEMHSGFHALRSHYPMNCRKTPFPAELRGDVQKDLTRLDHLWRSCLELSSGPALLGELGIIDVFFAPVVFRLKTYQLPMSKPCQAYADWMSQLPAMQCWLKEAREETEVLALGEWKAQ